MVVDTSECPSNSCTVRMSVKLCAARLALQMPAVNPQAMESAKAFMVRVARESMFSVVPVLQGGYIAGDCGAGGPRAFASTCQHAVASAPVATLRPCLNVTNHQGIAGI